MSGLSCSKRMTGDDTRCSRSRTCGCNEFLKLAMEQTAVKVGKNGFEKDKSPEATEDSPDNPDEYKTHITDAWDTLFVGANFFMPELAYAESGIIFLH